MKTWEDGVGGNYTVEFYHNDNLIGLNEPGVFDCRIKKYETYYNRNTTEYRMAYYNERNGDYDFIKVPAKDLSEPSIIPPKISNPSQGEGNLIILGTLLFIPFSVIIICIIGCCCCKRQRITTRRSEYETPLG